MAHFQSYQMHDPMPDEEYLNKLGAFKDKAHMIRCMSKPEYKQNPAYRAMVERAIQNSDSIVLGLEQPPAPADNSDEILARTDAVQVLFGDTKYKTSALYRKQVADLVAGVPDGESAPVSSGKTHRVQISSSPTDLVQISSFDSLRIQHPAEPSGANGPEPVVMRSAEANAQAAAAKPKMAEDWS